MDKKYIIGFLIGILVTGLIWGITEKRVEPPETVIITDTVTVDRETIKWKEKLINTVIYDTVLVVKDSIITVEIPIETKRFTDSIVTDTSKISYGAIYSGFKPSLDSMWVDYTFNPKIPVKRKKWGGSVGIGFQAGIGANYDLIERRLGVGPYFGVGISYQFGYQW